MELLLLLGIMYGVMFDFMDGVNFGMILDGIFFWLNLFFKL